LAIERAMLRAEAVSMWRGGRCLFEALDFALEPAKLALLVGPNGAGKTTLLRVFAGLAEPSGGNVTWAGQMVSRLPAERRRDIAYRGHLDGLKKDLSVRENLDFYAALLGGTGAEEALRELKLEDAAATRARYLSAGQRRRAALATLRVALAKLWILDEPMTNLDSQGRATVVRWVDEHLAAGGSAVIATHQPEEFSRRGALVIEL
jgi:heme exporter protein A